MQLAIVKPSCWKSRREIRDGTHALVGAYQLVGMWCTKAEGEALGRKLLFGYTGWDGRYSQMTDASGHVLARMEPMGWWGIWYKLTYGGKDYRWRVNGWGTTFMIYDGETEIVRVRIGSCFKPGSVVTSRPMEHAHLVPLVLYGIYQQYQIASQAAAASGGGA